MSFITKNKKAYFEYEISEKFEAGIVLTGPEIKAIRAHRVNLNGTFCRIQDGEAWIINMHINETPEPERSRKLLMHKKELISLQHKTQQGFSLVPLSLYLKKGRAKLEIGLGRGKKLRDQRQTIRQRDLDRQQEREIKN